MPRTRRQHIVPRMHLRHWSNKKNQVWTYDLETTKLYDVSIENVCVRTDYHELESGAELPYPIEEVLAEEIEGPAAEPLRKLATGNIDVLTETEIDNLCVYFGYLGVRTPFIHRQMDKVALRLHHEAALKTLNDETRFAEFKKEWEEQHSGEQLPTVESLKEAIEGDSIRWSVEGNDHNLAMMMLVGSLTGKEYWNRGWTLLRASKGRQFICSDNPLVTITGLSEKGSCTETIIPISPEMCLLFEKDVSFDGINTVSAGANVVRQINTRLALHADRNLISTNERLLQRMQKIHQSHNGFIQDLERATPGDPPFRQTPFKNIHSMINGRR